MTVHHAIPDAALAQHIAILGKTGSGKTSTEKLAVEQVVADGFRVCVLDSVKSDWWGITSSADGKRPGLPFKILGGPRGHVPLHSSAGKVIGQLVGAGKLPLSIIDMADFEPGGLQRFFVDFAPALMRSARGVVYLVIEEAHEFAPKERSGIGAENMAIHWAKKLATAGRSKGIRLIVATQRIQALHNAVLGSCETVIAHRLSTPADQEPVIKWLKANVDKETQERVASSLSSLPTGTGWICSGEARIFKQVAFPKFKTYDNTATPTGDGTEIAVKTAPVDQDELRSIIGDAVKEAEANDPKALRVEIARLKSDIQKLSVAKTNDNRPDPAAIAKAEERGFEQAKKQLGAAADHELEVKAALLQKLANAIGPLTDILKKELLAAQATPNLAKALTFTQTAVVRPAAVAPRAAQPKPNLTANRQPMNGHSSSAISRSEQRILDAIRWWNVLGIAAPTHPQTAFIAGYSHKSGTWATYLSRLRSANMIEGRGDLVLTPAGIGAANEPEIPPSGDELRATVLAKLDGPLTRILSPIIEVYPKGLDHSDAGERAGYSHTSGTWATYLSRLRSLDLIDGRGELKAQDWLFP